MTNAARTNQPSPFVARWLASFPPCPDVRALDVACGRGRHSLALARAGYRVVAIDIQLDALRELRAAALAAGLPIAVACADLTRMPLPRNRFGLIVVTRYLDRALFPSLREALVPGGVLLYETFTEHQLRYEKGPRSRAHLLQPGELRRLVPDMDVLFDEEVMGPDAVARIAVRRRAVANR